MVRELTTSEEFKDASVSEAYIITPDDQKKIDFCITTINRYLNDDGAKENKEKAIDAKIETLLNTYFSSLPGELCTKIIDHEYDVHGSNLMMILIQREMAQVARDINDQNNYDVTHLKRDSNPKTILGLAKKFYTRYSMQENGNSLAMSANSLFENIAEKIVKQYPLESLDTPSLDNDVFDMIVGAHNYMTSGNGRFNRKKISNVLAP